MSLQDLLAQGRLRHRRPTKDEIKGIQQVADRDLQDAGVRGLSSDRCFLTAYEAALSLATLPLRCAGYETHGQGHHWTTFQTLPLTMGEDFRDLAIYLESCRIKRNIGAYDRSGGLSRTEAVELLNEAKVLREGVADWLRARFPESLD